MRKYKLLPLVAVAILATGCANTGMGLKSQDKPATNSKNALVGMSVESQLESTKKALDDQLSLLKAVNSGQELSSYNMVTHNNNVDARVGSTNTLPIQYGQQNVPPSSKLNGDTVATVATVEAAKEVLVEEKVTVSKEVVKSSETNTIMSQKVKRIVWKNDSLNTLAKNLAKSIGFEFVTKPSATGVADANVDYAVENVTVREAIGELSKKATGVADVLVFEENKTVNVLYK